MAAMCAGTAGLLTWTPRAHAATINKTFYITEGFITQADGVDVYFRGFSNSSNSLAIPGEHMIVQEGDTVNITIVNTLNSDHNFSIDGLNVDSGRIRGGDTATVSFTASDPGTYLYYDADNAPYNRLTGLHGGFAVMPSGSNDELYSGSPDFAQQYFWVFHDIDPVWNNAVGNGNTPNSDYSPRYFTINGLGGRPPGAPGNADPNIDAMHDPRSALHGHVGDRTLLRVLNPGLCQAAVHTHANHMEWLTDNGKVRDEVWLKDIIYLEGDMGKIDAIFPFELPPDAWPRVSTGTYPMHLHTEMSQTSGGGLYMFGSLTDIYFE
jgi:plastocyanin